MMDDKPKLRHVEAAPIEMKGERVIGLRDPAGLSKSMIAIAPAAFFIVAQCDGQHTIADIQAEFEQHFGQPVKEQKIRDLLDTLEGAFMLEGEKFEAHKREIVSEFQCAASRKAAHAGSAYPRKAEQLRSAIDDFFAPPNGPGAVDRLAAGSGVVAIAAPHIDMQRGGPCYAHAYKALVEGCRAQSFVILGTLHQHADAPFIVIDKDFETPLGKIECDHEFTRDLMERAGLASSDDDLAHLREHSVEFQAVFLKHFYGASQPVRIVPVLCGPLTRPDSDGAPLETPAVAGFITALRDILRERGDRAAVIASVDLSHVGKRFGDQVGINQDMLNALEVLDRALLRHAVNMDADAFFRQNHDNRDRTHVCGFPALYTLLSVIQANTGRLLKYDQALEPEAESVVTFAAMAFEK